MRPPSHLYGRGAFEPVEERPVGELAMGLNCRKDEKNHHFFPSKRNKAQTRHVLVGTIDFHLMLMATRNLVELVRSRRRLGGVGNTPVEGPIPFNGGRERRFLVEQKVDVCFLLRSGRLVHVIFV